MVSRLGDDNMLSGELQKESGYESRFGVDAVYPLSDSARDWDAALSRLRVKR